jgi:ubiquinone/menaquinone biosynthesis C-methylase UbiE
MTSQRSDTGISRSYDRAVSAESYTLHADVQARYVGVRDASVFLPFLLAHLRPGVSVVDCGCGVGALTIDLALRVAPGRVVGVDLDESQLVLAREEASRRAVANVEFTTGSVYALPFEDATFDVAVANAVLVHLAEPVAALREIRRVLRAGGIAAVSDDDLATVIFSPDLPELQDVRDLFVRALLHNGGSPSHSRHLRGLMLDAGFARTEGFAHAPETYGHAESTSWFAQFLADLYGPGGLRDLIVSQQWASEQRLDEIVRSVREWGQRPDAFLSWLYCAALGWNQTAE